MKGTKVGSYIVEEKIGQGGMGVVYAAKHARMNRKAVVKVLRKHLIESPEIAKRFENEANAAASIGHPGIVQVFDIGQQEDGSLYIVMELLDGESLQERLDRVGKLPVQEAITLVSQCADALGAAHAAGIIHRDLKPENIFIVPDSLVAGGERTKLLDFGIAKLQVDGVATMGTSAGALMGTPPYMSPEQCQGAGGVERPSDLYSLGCILFQLVTGRTPFVGPGVGDYIIAHTTKEPPLLRSLRPEAPEALENIVSTLLSKKPDERFASCAALVAALNTLKVGPASIAPPSFAATGNQDPRTAPTGGAGAGDGSAVASTGKADPRMAATKVAGKQPGTTLGLSAGEKADTGHSDSRAEDRLYDRQSGSKMKVAAMGALFAVLVAGVGFAVVSGAGESGESGERIGASEPSESGENGASGETIESGESNEPTPAAEPIEARAEMVAVMVRVFPAEAEVLVDGEPVKTMLRRPLSGKEGQGILYGLEFERGQVVALETRSPGYESAERSFTAEPEQLVTVTLEKSEDESKADLAEVRRAAWLESRVSTRMSINKDAISARGRFKVAGDKTTLSMRYDEIYLTCVVEFDAEGNPSMLRSCSTPKLPLRIKPASFACKVDKKALVCRVSKLQARVKKEQGSGWFRISRPRIDADQPVDSAGAASAR